MELNEFITETLKQIIEGTQGVQKYIKENSIAATVNPTKSREQIENIEFDVAITTTSSNTKELKGGIKIASIFSGGGELSDLKSTENVSRIKFKVQVELPRQENDMKSFVRTTVVKSNSSNSY